MTMSGFDVGNYNHHQVGTHLKCSMWNMALFPRQTLAGRTLSLTSYCDVVSQGVSSVSGVTDMPSSRTVYSSVFRRDASEVDDDASSSLRSTSVYFRNCSRVRHIIGFPLILPFVKVHCRNVSQVCFKPCFRVRPTMLGLSQMR